jgi:small multidrug resistance pump
MHWLFLLVAILLEVVGTTSMKLSHGFTRWVPSLVMAVCYIASLTVLNFALKKIDVSMAYAIWSGVGTALIAAIGIYWFREPVTPMKLGAIALIIAGVIGLHLSGGAH